MYSILFFIFMNKDIFLSSLSEKYISTICVLGNNQI